MWKNSILKTALLLILLTGITACQDDDVIDETVLVSGPVSISVPQNPWHIPAQADFYMFYVESQGYAWTASTESDWLTLETTQGQHGGSYLNFSVEENTDPFARIAVITIADSQNPDEYRLQVRIRQSGYNDEYNATLTGDMLKKHRMGYGYNVMKDYASDNSYSNSPILDYDQVVAREEAKNILIITEDRRHYQEIETFSGNTLTELSGELTKSMTSGGTFLGCGKVTTSSSSIFRSKTIDQTCGYIRLKQITSSRTIDLGALAAEATSDDSPLYSKEFREAIRNMKSVGDASNVINTFGTHLVSSADLGGSISLEVLISREQSVEKEHSVTTVTKKVFGKKASQSSSTYDNYVEQNGLDYQASVSFTGGSTDTQNAIRAYINRKEQVPPSAIISWQNSFQTDPAETSSYNVGMIGCQLTPIYTLVNDPTKRALLEEAYNQYTNTQVTKPEDTPATVDIASAQQTWKDGNHKRVLIGKSDNTDRVLLANEYVPTIRTDKTVTVAYPILNGKAFYYSGVFVGDEDHAPGFVRWLGANPVYEPSEEITADNSTYSNLFNADTKSLKELYIYNGGVNILPSDEQGKAVSFSQVKAPKSGIPLVKVGSYLWGEETSKIANAKEKVENNSYYTQYDKDNTFIQYTQGYSLPDEKALQSIMQITTAYDPYILFGSNSEQKNELGLRWAKGFWGVTYRFIILGERKIEYDNQAFILPVKTEDNTIEIGRCSLSTQVVFYTPSSYFKAINQAHENFSWMDETYIPVIEVLNNIPTK